MLEIVLEGEVGASPRHRRVAAHRVVADVPGVVVPLGHRQPGLEGRVEDRRGRLADTAADRRDEDAAEDHLALPEPALDRARADDLVVGERLACLDDRAVEVVPEEMHVPDPVRRREAHVGREGRDRLADPERLRVLRRQLGRERREPQHGEPATCARACVVDRALGALDVEGRPVLRLDDVGAVARDAEGGVLGLLRERLDERMQLALDPGRVEDDVHRTGLRLETEERRELDATELADAALAFELESHRSCRDRAGGRRRAFGRLG